MARKPISPQFWRCFVQVRKIAGESLTDREIEDLANILMAKARSIRAERYGMTAEEAVDKALKAMAEDLVTRAQLAKRNTYLNNSALTREISKIQTTWADDPRAGLTANYVGANTARRGAQRSIDADQKGLANDWVNGFGSEVERTGKFKLWARGDLDEDVYRALEEQYKDNPDYTGLDRDAREFSEVIYKYQELFRVSANNAGAFIKKLPDYITHQSHDMFKVRNASATLTDKFGQIREAFNYNDDVNFRAWYDFVLPLLDSVKTFAGTRASVDQEAWMRHVWRSVATGEHLSAASSSNNGFTAPSSMAGRMSEPRILHFKDANARFAYDSKFGRGGSLMERIIMQLNQGGHNVALMTRMGPNPELTHGRLKNAARLLTEQSVTARMASKWATDELYIDAMWDEITGVANLPGASPIATALRTVRSIQTLSKLGGAVISSIVDTSVAASELQYQGFSAIEAWRAQFDGVVQGRGKRGQERAERMQAASELGVGIDVLRGGIWSRFSAEDAQPGWQARMQHMFFKVNGLMWWTDTLRLSNAQAMSHRIAMMTTRPMTELDSSLQRLFKVFDISSDEWDLMRGRAVGMVEGKEFFSPKAAQKLTDVEIAYLLKKEGSSPTVRRVAERRNEIQAKFRDIFAARADYAVVTPGPRTRAIMSGRVFGAQPGTLSAELARSVFQFKGFPMAIVEKVWGREFFGYGETGKVKNASMSGMQGMASFLAYSTLLGFASIYLKSYFNGRRLQTPETNQDIAALFLASFVQGGGAGLYGDFLFGQARDRYGHSALEAMAGPTAGLAVDAYSGLRGGLKAPFDLLFDKAKDGDSNAAGAFFALKNNLPFVNLFYTRMALDYLFLYRLQEYVAPGSLKRTEENFKKNLHQEFKVPPSSNYRAEELTGEDVGTLLNPGG